MGKFTGDLLYSSLMMVADTHIVACLMEDLMETLEYISEITKKLK
jgi:hypothetical protein